MPKARRKSPHILYPSTRQQIESVQKKLPTFNPRDLRSLVNAAKKAELGNVNKAFTNEYEARVHEQETELLRGLGINPGEPNAWREAFRLLATYDRGLGQISWTPQRSNKGNASRWTNDHNLNLLREVTILKGSGLSEREAIKRLARDKSKRALFPYRPQRSGDETQAAELKRYEAALRQQIQHLKAKSNLDSIFRVLAGAYRGNLSAIEQVLAQYDDAHTIDYLVNLELDQKDTS
jgi:hypothetical protein